MNEGSRLLASTGASLRAVATAAGVSHEAVRGWRTGVKVPAARAREALRAAYGIDPAAWDRVSPAAELAKVRRTRDGGQNGLRATAPRARSRSGARSTVAGDIAGRAPRADDARTRVQAQLERIDTLRKNADLTPAAKLQLETAEGRALALLARLSGEAMVLDERRIVASPAFRRAVEVIVKALRPWPAAQMAAADALSSLGG